MGKKAMVMSKAVVIILVLIVVSVVMWWAGDAIVKLGTAVFGLGSEPCEMGKITEKCKCGGKVYSPDDAKYCCEGKISDEACVMPGEDTINIKRVLPNGVVTSGNAWKGSDNEISGNTVEILFDKTIEGYTNQGHPALETYSDGWWPEWGVPDEKDEWKKVQLDVEWRFPIQDADYKVKLVISGMDKDTAYLVRFDKTVSMNSNRMKINPHQNFVAFHT